MKNLEKTRLLEFLYVSRYSFLNIILYYYYYYYTHT